MLPKGQASPCKVPLVSVSNRQNFPSANKLIRKISSKQIYLNRLEEEAVTPRNEGREIDCSYPSKDEKVCSDKVKVKYLSLPTFASSKEMNGEVNEGRDCDCLPKHNGESCNSRTKASKNAAAGQRGKSLPHVSETASAIIQTEVERNDKDPKKSILFEDDRQLDVLFQKVHYKQNVRYLRHTPSSTSLDNNNLNYTADDEYTDASFRACTISPISDNEQSLRMRGDLIASSVGKQQNNCFLPVNVTLGSKHVDNYQELVITEEPDYFLKMTAVVKYDINGNSWEDETLWNPYEQAKDYQHHHAYFLNDSPKSSFHSSSTTIETWIEEEEEDAIDTMLLGEQQFCSYRKKHCLNK
uniref:Uncharacterized protein n=1 Tax=Glossina austeni TaxID=7395 RepID=A0A1A9UZ49_GLOAU